MKKKSAVLFTTVVALAMFSGVAYSASGLKLIVNGNVITPEVPPQIIDGSTMVPIRAVSEALGADVQWKEAEQTVIVNQPDRASLQRQIDLLQAALAPESADEVVKAWAKGVKNRNGAAQYALLSAELRKQTAKTYEELNWVTGVSSPWIDSYQVSDSVKAEDGSVSYKVTFQLKTSTGSAGEGTVKVTVGSKDGKWMVTGLSYKDGSDALNGLVVVPGA
ncbi:copper amine oxidase N-terminal domain-containing protein [Paenibacillus whitsoniae]|uniref:Copper amine oxidase N-terminal domain-containing protein n=1 Tax=Paenibacillus whitsoniae TaxID=2496558 RepID=A0A430JEA2_9BACL|nr:copper amine oxidase N-terminal domain-containing protein [Paenibacillus whitsoniae]RTE09370.1 copper amine oxidase N-terminal domain-containing protein [Paenibacillus whitsoniae]